MFWTRVREVYTQRDKRLTIFNVDEDLKSDKQLRNIRRHIATNVNPFLFDPESHEKREDFYKIEDYWLSDEKLEEYALECSAIQKQIARYALGVDEEIKDTKEDIVFNRNEIRMKSKLSKNEEAEHCILDLDRVYNVNKPKITMR